MKRLSIVRHLRRRLFIIFFVAVLFPSLIQAYLGLRYVRQEEQRQEQIVLRGLKSTLTGLAIKTEENVEQAVFHMLDSLISSTSLSSGISPSQLYVFLSDQTLFKDVFVINHSGHLLYPRTFLAQKRRNITKSTMSTLTRQRLISGEEYEARGNYDEALNKYSLGLNNSRFTSEKMAFLVRIARCYFKEGNFSRAEKIYRRVLAEDNNHFYGEEMPYQLIASFQLIDILDRNGQTEKSFDILVRLYGNMLQYFHCFTEMQFLYYLDKVHEDIKQRQPRAGIGAVELIDSLMWAEEHIRQEPAQSGFLEASVVPSLIIALLAKSEPNNLRFISIDDSIDHPTHIAFMDLGYQAEGSRIIGAILHDSRLISYVEEFLSRLDTLENLQLVLYKENSAGNEAVKSNIIPIAEEPLSLLDGTIPGYKLILTGIEGTSLKVFISRGVIPYYAIILIILLVIALGVIFIFQDISREQELTRMKSEFISNVTHEIKTPIATIRGLAENVNEGWVTSQDKQQEYFRLIARESERLGHLVENTLDFSRIESGSKRYNMELGSIQEVVERTIERFKLLTEGQDVKVHTDIDTHMPSIYIDRVSLGQAILNLLDNAAKYSPEEKVIHLHTFVEKDKIGISVSDKGIGIDRKDISRIFDKFYRSDTSLAGKITGSGIGLTLVKEIVDSHGGTVTVDSEPNKGSTLTIRIPINIDIRNGKDIID